LKKRNYTILFIYIFFKVQIDAFMNIYFSIMEIAVDTYARIGRISFFTFTSWTIYLSACFI